MSKQSTHRIHRHNYENQFTILPNHIWEHELMSWGAKSLLAYLLSRPANWIVYRAQLSKVYKGEKRGNGRDSVDGWFKELIHFGFINYTPKDEKTGKFIHRYDVYPEPIKELKEKVPKAVKPEMDKTPNGPNNRQTNNDFIPRIEKNKQSLDIIPPNEELKISSTQWKKVGDAFKRKTGCDFDEENQALLCKRIFKWEKRQSDLHGANTIIKNWETWSDNATVEEVAKSNNLFLDSLKKYDSKIINNHAVYIGKMSTSRYIEFICGQRVDQFICNDSNFIRIVTDYFEKRLMIKLS